MQLFLREDLAEAWDGKDPFLQAAVQQGDVFREREGRRTLRFQAGEKSYFLKYHGGIGWREIGKNISQLKRPVLGAMDEVAAVAAISEAGIDTMTVAGYGCRGGNPAKIESFIVTDDLQNTNSLEEVAEGWWCSGNKSVTFKRELIEKVAEIVRRMHGAGINHRDLYLAHFLMPLADIAAENGRGALYLIDLHRAQIRTQVPRRWRIKDLGGLYFSAANVGLTRRDLLRFLRIYSDTSLRQLFSGEQSILKASRREGERLYRRHYSISPGFPLQPAMRRKE